MPASVRTVLGDLAIGTLGRVDYHEHVFQVSPLLVGDELDDLVAGTAEVTLFRESGFESMVDATPIALGRRPAMVAALSADVGVAVIATTGVHRDAHYASGHWLVDLAVPALTSLLVRDIRDGMPVDDESAARPLAQFDHRPVRAGVLKAGIDYWHISHREREVLAAVSAAHSVTGAPVMIHLEHGSAAFEVLAVLAADEVAADAVCLAHIDRNPDPVLHADLAEAGAYLGYDGFARSKNGPDSVLIDCLAKSIALGAGDRLLLGGDVARRTRYIAYGGMPGLAYLGDRVVPRLENELGRGPLDALLKINPARWLARF